MIFLQKIHDIEKHSLISLSFEGLYKSLWLRVHFLKSSSNSELENFLNLYLSSMTKDKIISIIYFGTS